MRTQIVSLCAKARIWPEHCTTASDISEKLKDQKTTPIAMTDFAGGMAEHAFPKSKGRSQMIKNTAKATRQLALLRLLFPEHTLKMETP